jgi:hypothetical protein
MRAERQAERQARAEARTVAVELNSEVVLKFRKDAIRYGTNAPGLIVRLLDVIAEDELVAAILDE